MRPNRLKELWNAGKPAINGWLNIPDAFVAEVVAAMGWDAVTIDAQHGLIGQSEVVAMLQAVSAQPVTPLVRVPWNSPGEIMKALDAGAYGVICPMVSNRAQAEAFVGACRYPPAGYRSFGPIRASVVAGAGYAQEANGEMLALAMIETREGLEKVDEIAATPGLDGIYIGPSDLSLALGGQPNQDSQEPMILAAFQTILDACKRAGIRAGVHTTSVAYAQQMIAMGFDLVTVGADIRWLSSGRREAQAMREHIAGLG